MGRRKPPVLPSLQSIAEDKAPKLNPATDIELLKARQEKLKELSAIDDEIQAREEKRLADAAAKRWAQVGAFMTLSNDDFFKALDFFVPHHTGVCTDTPGDRNTDVDGYDSARCPRCYLLEGWRIAYIDGQVKVTELTLKAP